MSHICRPDVGEIIPKEDYKVALIFPRTFEERASVLSQAGKEYLGFEELFVAFHDAGYPIQIYNAEQKGLDIKTIVDQVVSSNTKAVGINLTAMTAKDGLRLADKLREESPSLKIFLGGHHISLAVSEDDIFSMPEFNAIDAVVVGKGDLSFPLAVDCLRRSESPYRLPDVVFRENPDRGNIINAWRAVPLSKYPIIPHIQLDDTFEPNNESENKSARMSTSEGCIGNCSFCTSVKLYDRNYNPRSVKQIVNEIDFLQKQHNINSIFFNDDIFIKPGKDGLKRADQFCDELEKRNMNINFRPLLRPDSIPFTQEGDALFRKLKEHGMVMVFAGFEFGGSKMLDLVDKMVDVGNYKKFVERAKKEKVAIQLGFIAWHPLMNIEDAHQNFQLLHEIDELFNFSVTVQKLDIFPGTEDKRRLIENGLLPQGFNCLSDPQDYSFFDKDIGKLADSLNRVYRNNNEFEKFDKAISKLHLTIIPDLIHRAEKLFDKKPSYVLSEDIQMLESIHDNAIRSVNDLIFGFIKEHLESYGQEVDLDKALKAAFDRISPQLQHHLQIMSDAVEYLNNSCLRPEGRFEQFVDNIFPWTQFPDRIDRNIAIGDGGMPILIEKLLHSKLNFKVITDNSSMQAINSTYPELENLLVQHIALIDEEDEDEINNLMNSNYDCVIGMGGGNILDLTKLVANRLDIPMFLLPTILSSNTFSSPVMHPIGLHSENILSSKGRMPDFVLIDPTFLSKQNTDLNKLGYGDIIATYSAREDWKEAVKGGQSQYNYAIEKELEDILDSINNNINLSEPQGVIRLAKLLTRLSYCTVVNDVGSNPASGSEKIFSSAALQDYGDIVHHGDMMSLGTLQGRDVEPVLKILRHANFNLSLNKLNLDRNKLIEILIGTKQISITKNRINIIDKYLLDRDGATSIVNSLIEAGYISE